MQQPEQEAPVQGEVVSGGEIYQSPENIERTEGIKATPSGVAQQNTSQVAQDANQQGQQTTTNDAQEEQVEVVLPDQPTAFSGWKKESPDYSQTWLKAFWERVVKKAQHFGWHVLIKQNR